VRNTRVNRWKEFKGIEKNLFQKNKDKRENEIVLSNADFKDGKLSMWGYTKLKDECEYIDYHEDVEIIVPKEYVGGFRDTLEGMAANELAHIKKEKRETQIRALIFLIIGMALFAIGQFVHYVTVAYELTTIITWVFIWTAVEKFFFDHGKLQERRSNILQILAGEVIPQ